MRTIIENLSKIKFILIFAFLGASFGVFGQSKKVKHDSQIWLQYFLISRLTEKWSVNFDAGYRRTDQFINKPLQWLVRGGVSYHLNKDISISGGYAYFSIHTITSKSEMNRSEHRPWLRYSLTQKYKKWQIQNRYRLELRNIQNNDAYGLLDSYNSYVRSACQLSLQYVFKGEKIAKGVPFLQAYNEVFVNFGSKISSNFDQNRVYIGAGYGLSDQLSVSLGYQYIYSQQNTIAFSELNTIRFNIIQNLDFQKPKTESDENKKTN